MTYNLSYERANSDSKGPRPGTVALRNYILAAFPGTRDLGIYVYRPIRGSTSSLSVHSEGRAWDCGVAVDPGGKKLGDAVADWVTTHAAEAGIQYMIWYRRSWRADRGWRPYSGANPHIDHVHLEQTREAASTFSVGMLTSPSPIAEGPSPHGRVNDPPWQFRPIRSVLGVPGGSVLLTDNGDIYCPTSRYYGSTNNEILGREFDVLGEPWSLRRHPTVPDGYLIVTDLHYAYAYPDE
jgi:hypothetical protein